ncbi:MAG: hypothetical protein IJR59_07560 [Firmicutes bacterium]|nr:hypothetical protein [Bacillota bacterium]
MLAIQENLVIWEKNSRNPQGATERKPCFLPRAIDESVELNGNGIFVCKNTFYQFDRLYTPEELRIQSAAGKTHLMAYSAAKKKEALPFDDTNEKTLLRLDRLDKYRKGHFCENTENVDVHGIDIVKQDEKYVIKWVEFDYAGYKPKRGGRNEDFNRKGAKAQGRNVTCKTAFTLGKNEGGKLEFNYRYTSGHGQRYEQYAVYVVNTDNLEYDTFLKTEYAYNHKEMADLF